VTHSCAAVTLVPLPGLRNEDRCRQEWRHGTHECVRHYFLKSPVSLRKHRPVSGHMHARPYIIVEEQWMTL
jgi:hypothetical protein